MESGRICYELMNRHINGEEYVKSVLSYGMTMPHMLIADHLFGAAVELLENNKEQFSEENNDYILFYNATLIDPSMA